MKALTETDPRQFIADFFTSFSRDLLGGEDPEVVVDRYHTPDVVEIADGVRLDRDKLVAHTRPVRKNRPEVRVEVHEAVADGDRLAARYTLDTRIKGRSLAIEAHFFGRFAPDGRLAEAHVLTRTLPSDADTPPAGPATTDRQESPA
ncbi:MAG TPA: nuclear transport factor 2 family protein [Nocardioidaceae bacterium]|jgi:ketosteroid isomerase-like protein